MPSERPWTPTSIKIFVKRFPHEQQSSFVVELPDGCPVKVIDGIHIQLVASESQQIRNASSELYEALKKCWALFLPDHAISRFNWGKSALRAEDIRELNELPGLIRAALLKALPVSKTEGKT